MGLPNRLYQPLTRLWVREGCSIRETHWLPGADTRLLDVQGQGLDLLSPPPLPCQPHSTCMEKASRMCLIYEQKAGLV